MIDLIHAGLATATPQQIVAGKQRYEVAVVRITDAGRKALAELPCSAGLP
jgi:hypothetical protein